MTLAPMSNDAIAASIEQALAERFGERIAVDPALAGLAALEKIAAYRSHRQFLPRSIEPGLAERRSKVVAHRVTFPR